MQIDINNKKKRLQELELEIKKHSRLYYNENNPAISDNEYDILCIERDALEKELNITGSGIGHAPSEKFSKTKHISPMLSLANSFSHEDLSNFIKKIRRFLNLNESEKIEFICEPKIDGVSISITYENGKITKCSTRGNGTIGEDVTENIKHLFPQEIYWSKSQFIEFRGEIYITKQEFEKINNSSEYKFLNPRNMASGSIRQLDSMVTKKRNLNYFMYDVGQIDKKHFESQLQIMQLIKNNNFHTNSISLITDSIQSMLELHDNIYKTRENLNYEIDGIVYKVNKIELQERLGNANRYPRWAIAHKFPAKQSITTIENIEIQVGRTGTLTPVAILKPINLHGVVITRASLHNKDEIEKKDIRITDTAIVQRAGDIIPQIVEIKKSMRKPDAKKFIFPNKCPSCNFPTKEDAENVAIRCINTENCPAQLIAKIAHLTSSNAFNIEGLGIKQIANLFELNLIKKPSDIFSLEEKDLVNLYGWGKKSANNLILEIQNKKTIKLDRFIYSLGIRFIGTNTAKTIANNIKTYNNFRKILKENSTMNEILNIDGIGEKIIQSLKEFSLNDYEIKELDKIASMVTIENNDDKANIISKINGKTIVFTGTMIGMTRAEAKNTAEKLGAKITNSITKNTDFLIASEKSGSKLEKAKTLGIKILNEQEWLALTNNKEN